MLRRSAILRTVVNDSDPYHVLGVTPNTPFSEIRKRFYVLTQQLHPDMPHGDAVRFREVNAAYRQLRATHRKRDSAVGRGVAADSPGTHSARWDYYHSQQAKRDGGAFADADNATRNAGTHDAHDAGQSFRWSQATDTTNGPWPHRRARTASTSAAAAAAAASTAFSFSSAELLVMLGTLGAASLYGVQRYLTVWRLVREKHEQQRRVDEDLPHRMPMEVDDAWRSAYSTPPAPAEQQADTERILEEVSYRRATQRRFDDFREFMFVYDPDGVGERKVSTARFSHQYIDEAAIATRCPLVREFDSRRRETNYDAISKDVQQAVSSAPWWQPDVGPAGALLAKGVNCVPAASPNSAKWTFLEYMDTHDGSKHAEPVCLLALRNLRYTEVGVCQRIVVTGNAQLAARHTPHATSIADNGSTAPPDPDGKRHSDATVHGQPLPFRNTDVPLEKLQL